MSEHKKPEVLWWLDDDFDSSSWSWVDETELEEQEVGLVKCGKCKKLMGFHVPSTIQICVECKIGVQK